MSGPVLGVIGGLGPMATACFLEELTRMTDAGCEQEHVDMIIYNFPSIPDRTGYILGSNLKSPLPGLLWAGRALDREGVSSIVIPSITAHYFYDQLREELSAPVIHGVRATAALLKQAGVERAGILATDGTVASGLFTQALKEVNVTAVVPGRLRQADVMHLIYRNVKAGLPPEHDRFYAVEEELRQLGAQVLILGCAELSLLRREEGLCPDLLDTTQVLAREAILSCGRKLKKEYRSLLA